MPQRDSVAIARATRWVQRIMVPYRRARLHGLDTIPSGPALCVANHHDGLHTGDAHLSGAEVHAARGLPDTPWE